MTRHSAAWHARYFELRNGKFVERKVNQKGLDSLWAAIAYHQVLSLPNQRSLKRQMRNYLTDTLSIFSRDVEYSSIAVIDGINYQFGLSSKSKKRSYQYHCPATYLKHYPNIEELYRAYAIIIYIRRHLNLQLPDC